MKGDMMKGDAMAVTELSKTLPATALSSSLSSEKGGRDGPSMKNGKSKHGEVLMSNNLRRLLPWRTTRGRANERAKVRAGEGPQTTRSQRRPS